MGHKQQADHFVDCLTPGHVVGTKESDWIPGFKVSCVNNIPVWLDNKDKITKCRKNAISSFPRATHPHLASLVPL